MALDATCEEHDWLWDPSDDMGCPVCHGIAEGKKAKSEALSAYLEESWKLQQEIIAEIGIERWEASQHWVNNPLITPINKVAEFDKAIKREVNKTLDALIKAFDDEDSLCSEWAIGIVEEVRKSE